MDCFRCAPCNGNATKDHEADRLARLRSNGLKRLSRCNCRAMVAADMLPLYEAEAKERQGERTRPKEGP